MPNKMAPVDAAYLAGLLDGEGHIGLSIRGDRGFIAAKVEICITTPEVLVWCKRVTGAGIIRMGLERRTNRRQPWHWQVCNVQDACEILGQVEPYMKIKNAQARAFRVYAALKKCKNKSGHREYPAAEKMVFEIVRDLKTPGRFCYEEALDLCVYLKQAIIERDAIRRAVEMAGEEGT